jgi:hypothetical protein
MARSTVEIQWAGAAVALACSFVLLARADGASSVPPECALGGLPTRGGGPRDEPLLEGRSGWLMGKPESDAERVAWRKKPWQVPTLVQVGPVAWEPKGPPVAHKTPVTVVKESLRSDWHRWVGTLEVATQGDTRAIVDLRSFAFRPYWQCPLREAGNAAAQRLWQNVEGPIVATLAGGTKAVNRSGAWVELKKKETMLCSPLVREGEQLECEIIDARGRSQQAVMARAADVVTLY